MRIGLQTWGTDGDLLPFLALAIGLKKAGHEVTLAHTSVDGKDHAHRSETAGIPFISAQGNVDMGKLPDPYSIDSRPGSFREYSTLLKQYFDPHAEAMYSASEKLCRENDLVIGHAVCHTLLTASLKHRCPRVSLVLTPLVVRSKFDSPLGVDLGTILNSLIWWMGGHISTRLWFEAAKRIHSREGLKPVRSLQRELFTSDLLTLVAASRTLIQRPSDWAENVHISGFLNLPEAPKEDSLSPGLEAFLNDGEAPVYMTFGSCTQFDRENATRLMVEAAKLSGQRAIIQTEEAVEADPRIFRIGSAPHGLIFPRCSLVVHHGGAGTTQAALLAGKPSVVVAHGFDQPYWGHQLQKAGVAGKPLLKRTVSPRTLAQAIKATLGSNDLIQRAAAIGKKMKEEDGVETAVRLINGLRP